MRWRHEFCNLGARGLALLLAGTVPVLAPGWAMPAAARPTCRVTWIVDGDTLHIDCGHGEKRVRLLGYDTPEIYHPHCPAEAAAGLAETKMMRALVQSGPVTSVDVKGTDRYGRELARVSIGGRDVSAAMLKTPYARPYAGHAHPDWCAILGYRGTGIGPVSPGG